MVAMDQLKLRRQVLKPLLERYINADSYLGLTGDFAMQPVDAGCPESVYNAPRATIISHAAATAERGSAAARLLFSSPLVTAAKGCSLASSSSLVCLSRNG